MGSIPDVAMEYLVDGFIPKSSVTVIAGAPGSLKSFLALDISRCLAAGTCFAGRASSQCKVLYIDRENPASVIRQRTHTLAIGNHAELHYWGLWCDETPPPLGEPRVIDFARSETNTCIVYDSLIRFHHADENDATEMGKIMGELRQLAAAGATVIVLLHKSDKSENNYRGSSEILAGCDVMWSIEKQPDNKTIELKAVKNRYCEETKFALRLEDGGFVEAETSTQAESTTALQMVEALVMENPGATKSRLEDRGAAKGLTRQQVRSALENERFTTIPGLHNSKGYYVRSEAIEGYAVEV
jgi:predicted ATP-dependent serine protease